MLPRWMRSKPTLPRIVLPRSTSPGSTPPGSTASGSTPPRSTLPRWLLAELPEYKPPSMLAQHKGLAIVFGILFLALALWCITTPRGSRYAPRHLSLAQPIYVEPVPDKDPPQQ